MTAQLLLGLSLLVGLHELGHLLTAKLFKMKVEKYFIGFPPKLFSVKLGETEYGLGALPFGGFVKISGMIDESLDSNYLENEPKPWEFRAKPAWQRLIVMLGGIIVNVITGMFIFICLVYSTGESYYSMDEVNKHGIYVSEMGRDLGFRNEDKVLSLNGKKLERFEEAVAINSIIEEESYYTIMREGNTLNIPVPSDFLNKISDGDSKRGFIFPLRPFAIEKVVPNSHAERAGLMAEDQIVKVDNNPAVYFQIFKELISQKKGDSIQLVVNRRTEGGKYIEKTLAAKVSEDGTLGFYSKDLLERSTKELSFIEAIPKGVEDGYDLIALQVKAFKKMFAGDISPSKSISGPIGIAKVFGGTWNWYRFWSITAMLSLVLAFMNILPIPALDGGHALFLTYEIISGRKPSDNFLKTAQKIGMILLLALMAFAFGNDIYKLIIG